MPALLNPAIEFLTSKTGLFAAVLVVLGLVGSLWKFWGEFTDRRTKAAEAAAAAKHASQGLAIADLTLSELSRSSNAYDLQFVLTNTGSNHLIMQALRLHVTARNAISKSVPSYTMAPIAVYKHRVAIVAGKDAYDIRERTFGKGNEPLAFAPDEAAAFLVKLVSDETMQYVFHVEAEWYGAADVAMTGKVSSTSLTAEFPERVSSGPAT